MKKGGFRKNLPPDLASSDGEFACHPRVPEVTRYSEKKWSDFEICILPFLTL